MTLRLALIGGGNMGFALASALTSKTSEFSLVVSDPHASQLKRFTSIGIETTYHNDKAAESADVVLIAVKPNMMQTVVQELHGIRRETLVVSIVAGVTLATLCRWFGQPPPIVRAMPNTPLLIGEGIAGLICNDLVNSEHRQTAESILGAGCELVWLESDTDLDIVTAISGSGPAYFFYLMESLSQEAQQLGMSRELARKLVVKTALGAAKMAYDLSEDPKELRRKVSSLNGTTQAAIEFLDSESAKATLARAAREAFLRSQEIGKELARPHA